MTLWDCPLCDRRFGATNRPHVCVPALSIDAYFANRPADERTIFDAILAVFGDVDLNQIEIEAVTVGVLFRARRTFAELRPRRSGVSLSIVLPSALESERVTRRVRAGRGIANFFVIADARQIDDEVADYLRQSFIFWR